MVDWIAIRLEQCTNQDRNHRAIVGDNKRKIDLPTLVDTRLLIRANSGGGKSWLLRITQSAGNRTIAFDNEALWLLR